MPSHFDINFAAQNDIIAMFICTMVFCLLSLSHVNTDEGLFFMADRLGKKIHSQKIVASFRH